MVNVVTEAITTVYIEGSSRKEEVSGLTPFTEYSFTVTAEYKYGAGPPSETVTQRTKEHGKLQVQAPSCTNYIGHTKQGLHCYSTVRCGSIL